MKKLRMQNAKFGKSSQLFGAAILYFAFLIFHLFGGHPPSYLVGLFSVEAATILEVDNTIYCLKLCILAAAEGNN